MRDVRCEVRGQGDGGSKVNKIRRNVRKSIEESAARGERLPSHVLMIITTRNSTVMSVAYDQENTRVQ